MNSKAFDPRDDTLKQINDKLSIMINLLDPRRSHATEIPGWWSINSVYHAGDKIMLRGTRDQIWVCIGDKAD